METNSAGLTNAFDTLGHTVLETVLHFIGFYSASVNIIKIYLSSKFCTTKRVDSSTVPSVVTKGVPQGLNAYVCEWHEVILYFSSSECQWCIF